MKKSIVWLFILLFGQSYAQNISNFIHVDQFGYPPNGIKVAVISNPQQGYNASASFNPSARLEVRKQNNQVVFSAAPSVWNNGNTHGQSGDQGWWFDFSSLTTPGTYYIIDPVRGERSGNFVISEDVYTEVMKVAGRMFYYNRCNTAKPSQYAGQWNDGESFLNPLQDANCRSIDNPGDASQEKDLSGGWFDAGDYNKYVTFTNTTLHYLLSAYEENPDAFSDNWNIPESNNGIPDIIDEIKWELDWLFKMTNADGSVHIKMGSRNHGENASSPPSVNTDPRYYGPTCSSASIVVASVFAHAAKVFADFPALQSYANDLRQTAITCFNYSRPFVDANSYETNCDDLRIVAGDADNDASLQLANFVSAAIYLFEESGSSVYHNYITTHARSLEPLQFNFWGPYLLHINDALLLYAGLNNANASLANDIRNSFSQDVSNNYNGYFGFSNSDLYRAPMPDWSYHWGSNQAK
ncbi:MAG: glycoside hydrolase family 9 protein, partial [Bacteroidota bacterium]